MIRGTAKLIVTAGLLVGGMVALAKSGSPLSLPHQRSQAPIRIGVTQVPRFAAHAAIPEGTNHKLVEAYGKLPLSFEANEGQTDSRVKFLSRDKGYTLFLTPTDAILGLAQVRNVEFGMRNGRFPDPSGRSKTPHSNFRNPHSTVVRMRLVGANPRPKIAGLEELPGKSNYFIGNNPNKWRTKLPTFAKVQYENVWPGVDLVYYGNQRHLEYDFVVAPGADPQVIQLAFEGTQELHRDVQGELILKTDSGELRLQKPRIYQEVSGTRRELAGSYALFESPTSGLRRPIPKVGFQVAAYDDSRPLVIDPVLSYSTYLGGSGDDQGHGIAVDANGNAYVTGQTDSVDFPTMSPVQGVFGSGLSDAFVVVLNSAGSALISSTYLGGSGSDFGRGIAVNTNGNSYVTGQTDSLDFPTMNPIQGTFGGGLSDAFVAMLNAAGSGLVYSTYLGGSSLDGGRSIAMDAAGNAFVTGTTDSPNFPTANPLQGALGSAFFDAFVTKMNPAGSALTYSTYLGGSGQDLGLGIAVDADGNAYVTGRSDSVDFPTMSPVQGAFGGGFNDAFVAKLNSAGPGLVYSTYLGGGGDKNSSGVAGIAADSTGNAYVTGSTTSANFPLANPIQAWRAGPRDAFITKLDPAGSGLVYSTYLGGSSLDDGSGIAVDGAGNVYVTGFTFSNDFPTVNAVQAAFGGGGIDAFVTNLDAAGSSLVFSTYIGGRLDEGGTGIAVGPLSDVYVTGGTASDDFPTATLQPVTAGGIDAFVARIQTLADLAITMAVDHDQVPVGSNLTYTISVTNNGPDTATDVVITDSLSLAVVFVSSSASKGTCTGTTCNLGTIKSGEGATATMVVMTLDPGARIVHTFGNFARVSGSTTDLVQGNNFTGVSATVGTPAPAPPPAQPWF